MARPQEVLADITSVRDAGIDTIVSLLEPTEAAKFGLKDEDEICVGLGMTFLSHPIRDMHLPDPDSFVVFTANLAERLMNGANIAVHCYASIGRSGMLTCSTLGHFDFDPEMALEHVSAKRGVPVPDTAEQAAFVHNTIAEQTRR
jgi:protein-tyrosine phosphatase